MSVRDLCGDFNRILLTERATDQRLQQSGPMQGTLRGRSVIVNDICDATQLPSDLADIIKAYAKESAVELLLKLTFIEFVEPQLQADIRAKVAAWVPVDEEIMDYGAVRIDINCGFLPLRDSRYYISLDRISRSISFLNRGAGARGCIDIETPNIFPLLVKKVRQLYYPKAKVLVNPHGQSHAYVRTEQGTHFNTSLTVVKRGTDSDNLFNVGGNDMRHEELPAVCVRACPVEASIEDSEEDSSSRARERWIARATDKEPHYLVTVDLQPVTPTGRLVPSKWEREGEMVRQVKEVRLDNTRDPAIRITRHTGNKTPVVVLESRITQLPEELREKSPFQARRM